MTESNIQPLPYEKLAGDLLAVFRQIDAMRNPQPTPGGAFKREYPARSEREAMLSIDRAVKQHAKGNLTDADLVDIKTRCLAALADPPKAG